MNEFKKCKVVMLDTKDSTVLAFNFKSNELFIPIFNSLNHKECTYKHLYILSDDEIKEGDYVYDGKYNLPNIDHEVYKWSYENWIESPDFEDMKCSKIIASTDTSLGVLLLDETFIKQYVEANGFDEVLIEYAMQERHQSTARYEDNVFIENGKIIDEIDCEDSFELKEYIANKDNFVVFKQLKTSFNKEELPIQAIKDCLKYCENQQIYDKLSRYGDFYYKLNQFIKENNL